MTSLHFHAGWFFRFPTGRYWFSRILLLLLAALVVTSPVTQRLWTWDHFLRGGQDFELTALALLTLLCMVVVLAQHRKQGTALLFAAWRLPSSVLSEPCDGGTSEADVFEDSAFLGRSWSSIVFRFKSDSLHYRHTDRAA